MKKLITVRHGKSVGNQKKIIQGKTNDYGLTEEGKKEIEKIGEEYFKEFRQVDKIIASPTKRTIETANILNQNMDKPIEIEEDIIEFNPGILAGNTHEYNAIHYPEYYAIWKERGDLDKIPHAEKGKNLQARVISFIMRYIEEENFNDLIVSHAGYIRCLVNTLEGRKRTTPIDSSNGAVHIIENPLKNINIQHKDRAMASKVYIVETADGKYVAKIKNRPIQKEDVLEKYLLRKISSKLGNLPSVLNLSNTEQGSIKVLDFVNGEHRYGKLTEEETEALTKKIQQMHEVLKDVPFDHFKKIDLHEMMREKELTSKNEYIIKTANEILSDKKNIEKMKKSNRCLVHNDLNRDNILFNQNRENIGVNIIDWEGIKVFPEEYQIASFLASSILIEDGEMEEVVKIAYQFDSEIDEDYIIYLMRIRIFTGLHYFAENKNAYTKMNPIASREILKKYFIANEKIKRYQKDKKQVKERNYVER